MKLRNALLLQMVCLVVLATAGTGTAFIYINHRFLVMGEVESLFKEAENITLKINELKDERRIPENQLFERDTVKNTLRTAMYRLLNHYYNWEISFNIFTEDIYLFNRNQLDQTKRDIQAAKGGHKTWYLERQSGNLILRVAQPLYKEQRDVILYIEKNIKHIDSHRETMLRYLAIICTGALIILIPLSVVFSNFIIVPIKGLLKEMNAFKRDFISQKQKAVKIQEINELRQHYDEMTKEIQKQFDQLKMESESKEKFLSRLNHELNTPLTSITGFTDLLISNPSDEGIRSTALHHIKNESNRVKKLKNNLQNLFLPSTDFRWEEIDLNTTLQEAFDSLHFIAVEKAISFEIREIEKTIFANAVLIHTLLKNILHNAIKASSEGDVISLFGTYAEQRFTLHIKDQGIGMSHEILRDVREPYVSEFIDSENNTSTGLGLSICDQIIQYHNCSWEILSEKDQGTEIIIDFTTILQLEYISHVSQE